MFFIVLFGYAATIIPRAYTYYISTALFALFGLKMLKDGYYMSPGEGQEELEEVQSDLRKREDEVRRHFSRICRIVLGDSSVDFLIRKLLLQYEKEAGTMLIQDPETGVVRKTGKSSALALLSRILFQSFTLTFLAEWGDRSQLTTIILAAREVIQAFYFGIAAEIVYYFSLGEDKINA